MCNDSTTWERRFISTLLQFAILSVLTEPVMKAHLHVHVMRGLKETTAIHQVCQIQTYTLYCTYVRMHVQHIHMYHTTPKHVPWDVVCSGQRLLFLFPVCDHVRIQLTYVLMLTKYTEIVYNNTVKAGC